MFFIIISALHVSGGFYRPSSGAYKTVLQPWALSCFPPVYCWFGWVGTQFKTIHTSGRQQESMTMPKAATQFYKLLMMGEKTARNM